jgi:hypothetical protein
VTKIIARIFGGLGNQLFCYAAARGVALRAGGELVLDDVSGFAHDHAYRRSYQLDRFAVAGRLATPGERLEPLERARRFLLRRASRRQPFAQRRYIQQEGVDYDPRLLSLLPRGTVRLEGHWQSERYFADCSQTIRDDLTIQAPGDGKNKDMAARIAAGPSVFVHVRFFDAAAEAAGNAPRDYYARAVAAMEARVPDAQYFVFSDRPEEARAKLPIADDRRITIVDHNRGDEAAYADLWLMSQCQHAIIANSTFSWWGAWLGEKPRQVVIAPGFELRSGPAWWGFDGLLPERWTRL